MTPDPGPQTLAIVGGRIVLPDRVVSGSAVVIDGARIRDVVPNAALAHDVVRVDAGGRLVCPGLVDIHVHGAAGHGFDEPDPTAHAVVTTALLLAGVTSVVASIATAPVDRMLDALRVLPSGWTPTSPGARILGAHLEGPYLSVEQRGAHHPDWLRTPDDGSVDELLADAGHLRMVTLAPELPGAFALIDRLVANGVVAALGHSAADESVVRAAIDRGARHMTHLWSGQSTTVRRGPWRVPGLLEVSLQEDDVTAEMIADGRHLPATLMRLARKCLPPDRLCLVSDGTSGAGLAEGTRLDVDGLPAEIRDGVAMLLDGTSFAGSTTLLNRMVRVVQAEAGAGLADAVRMASLTPATIVGEGDRIGSLEAGKLADVVIFDDDMTPWRTMIEGRWIRTHVPQGTAS